MSDYRSDVYDAVISILGSVSTAQNELLLKVVEAVCSQVDHSLRQGISNSDCRYVYITACTLYSLSLFHGLSGSGISNFTAGTVSVSLQQDHSPLVQMADKLLANWTVPEIAFRGVRG